MAYCPLDVLLYKRRKIIRHHIYLLDIHLIPLPWGRQEGMPRKEIRRKEQRKNGSKEEKKRKQKEEQKKETGAEERFFHQKGEDGRKRRINSPSMKQKSYIFGIRKAELIVVGSVF